MRVSKMAAKSKGAASGVLRFVADGRLRRRRRRIPDTLDTCWSWCRWCCWLPPLHSHERPCSPTPVVPSSIVNNQCDTVCSTCFRLGPLDYLVWPALQLLVDSNVLVALYGPSVTRSTKQNADKNPQCASGSLLHLGGCSATSLRLCGLKNISTRRLQAFSLASSWLLLALHLHRSIIQFWRCSWGDWIWGVSPKTLKMGEPDRKRRKYRTEQQSANPGPGPPTTSVRVPGPRPRQTPSANSADGENLVPFHQTVEELNQCLITRCICRWNSEDYEQIMLPLGSKFNDTDHCNEILLLCSGIQLLCEEIARQQSIENNGNTQCRSLKRFKVLLFHVNSSSDPTCLLQHYLRSHNQYISYAAAKALLAWLKAAADGACRVFLDRLLNNIVSSNMEKKIFGRNLTKFYYRWLHWPLHWVFSTLRASMARYHTLCLICWTSWRTVSRRPTWNRIPLKVQPRTRARTQTTSCKASGCERLCGVA